MVGMGRSLRAGAWGGVGLQDSRPAPAGQSLGCLAQECGPLSGELFLFFVFFFLGGEPQVAICVMLREGTSLDGRLGHQAEPTPGTPLRRAQASRGQGLWVSADLFGERTSSLDEAQVWVVREGEASLG